VSIRKPLGDFEVTEPQAMRALAHPVRLAVLSHLQRHGPMTATELAEHVGASPSVTSWHLRHLASFGLVTDTVDPGGGVDRRRRWWKAVARGIRFSMPTGSQAQQAGRVLRSQMMAQAIEQVSRWMAEVEPVLDERWSREAGSGNTGLRLTPAEARGLERSVEELLAPYVAREVTDAPKAARGVRMVRFLLPEAPGAEDEQP
jgi:DNA-binding transcriptional ArsR family regulator